MPYNIMMLYALYTDSISKLPTAKSLLNFLSKRAKSLLNLRNLAKQKTFLRNLAKLVFAKPCETCICATLRNLAKQT